MPGNDSTLIQLFHDAMYGSPDTSRQASYLLANRYKIKPPMHQSEAMVMPMVKDKTYVFHPISHGGEITPWVSGENMQLEELKRQDRQYNAIYSRMPSSMDATYYRNKDPFGSLLELRWMPVIGIGLAISGSAASLYLKINDYNLFKDAVKKGQFVADWKGQRVWKLNFRGNDAVPYNVVKSSRAAFEDSWQTMKWVKGIEGATALLGVGVSWMEMASKGYTPKSQDKFVLDCIMTGVTFLVPFGWVISGLYFLTDGIAGVTGHEDWWHAIWDNFILPVGGTLLKAAQEAGNFNYNYNSNPLYWPTGT